jgi:hypothetical protein
MKLYSHENIIRENMEIIEYHVYVDGELVTIAPETSLPDIIDVYPIIYPKKKIYIKEVTHALCKNSK